MSVRSVLKHVAFPLVMVFICVVVTLLVLRVNQSADELKQRGKSATNVVTAITGDRGESAYDIARQNGFTGTEREWLMSLVGAAAKPVSAGEIQKAVEAYCADSDCVGRTPSHEEIAQAVVTYCVKVGCKGRDGLPVTDQQISAAIDGYCADGKCVGPKGDSITGPDGVSGTNGKTPILGCVSREANNTPTRFIAWKYDDESDAAYRDLYKLPTWAECTNPITIS